MADIFISYARGDRDKVEKLAAALQGEGWSVWWDRQIVGGAEFSKDIERELTAAKVAIVAWSKTSVDSRWVRDEAVAAAEAGKLVPVSLDGAPAPMGFRQFHTIELGGWPGDVGAPAFQEVARSVRGLLTGTEPAAIPLARASWAKRLTKPLPLAVIGAAMLALAGVLVWPSMRPASSPHSTPIGATPPAAAASAKAIEADATSIAVLPFADLSPAGDQEYFSQGIAEEILNVLANVTGLQVASRTSSFQFKGQEKIGVPLIAEQLHVRHILEGSVRKAGNTIRITAQLIDAETDKHLWSQTFDRTLTTDNIFAVQDEITKAIVEQLSSRVAGASKIAAPAVRNADTDNADAYALFLEGQTRFALRGQENILRSMSALERAVEIDPGFARAWAVLAADYSIAPGWLGGADLVRDFPKLAVEAARKATELDPSLSLPHAVLGQQSGNSTDYEAAFSNFEKAIERNQKDETIYLWRANVWRDLGFFDRALADYERCLSLNPDYNICRDLKSLAMILAGDVDGGLATVKENLRRGFDSGTTAAIWGAYLGRGDEVEFLYQMNELVRTLGPGDVHWAVEMMFLARTNPAYDRKEALRILEARLDGMGAPLSPRSFTETSVLFLFGAFDRMHPDGDSWWWATIGFPEWAKSPERKRLMRERKLDVYWREHGFPPQCKPAGTDDFECN